MEIDIWEEEEGWFFAAYDQETGEEFTSDGPFDTREAAEEAAFRFTN